jgi:endogenous inhibitor of DNA gyrase (YacG/DUF329 family)
VEVCTICRKPLRFSSEEEARRIRPFCSARCKLIDLGAWAGEEYRVPTNERLPDPNDEEA